MRHCEGAIKEQNAKYQARRDVVCDGLKRLGWEVDVPRASMFVWTRVPEEHTKGKGSIDFAMDLLDNANVVISPGRAFGENGEHYMRISLVENENRLRQAVRNIGRYVRGKDVSGVPKKGL
jgi:alanine-synthesizing transaminase